MQLLERVERGWTTREKDGGAEMLSSNLQGSIHSVSWNELSSPVEFISCKRQFTPTRR